MKYPILLCLLLTACDAPRQAKPSAPVSTPKPPAVRVSPAATQVAWLESERLMPVLEVAQRENKPVFVEFYASWCAPCKVMEEDVFTQPAVYNYLNKGFLNFRTDYDSPAGRTIAEIYEVSKLPSILFLDPKGVVLERYLGVAGFSTLSSLGDSALGKMGK